MVQALMSRYCDNSVEVSVDSGITPLEMLLGSTARNK